MSDVMIKKLTVFSFSFLLILSTVQATSLGTIKKNEYAEARPGETAIFTILFWSTDNTVPVKLTPVKIPENWSVMIRPDDFILNRSKPESPPYTEAEYFNSPDGAIKTIPVKVYVSVPRSEKLGTYEILVSASAGSVGKEISVLQERVFKFVVDVGSVRGEGISRLLDLGKDAIDKLTGMASAVTEQGNVLLIFVSAVTMIGISWIIKRRL